jgi:integrase
VKDKMARPYKYYSCCRKKECLCSVKGKHKWIAERGRSNFDRGSTKTFDTLREAEAWLRLDEVPVKETQYRFKKLSEMYLKDTKPPELAPKSRHAEYKSDISRLNLHINPIIGNIFVPKLKPSDINKIFTRSSTQRNDTRNISGIGTRSMEYIITTINRVLNWGEKNEFCTNNLRRKLREEIPDDVQADFELRQIRGLYTEDEDEIIPPTHEEIQKYLEFAMKHNFYNFFYMMATTGARIVDLRTVKWRDINLESKTMRLHSKTQSGNRNIQINDSQIDLLKKHKDDLVIAFLERDKILSQNDFVFPNVKTITNPKLRGLYGTDSISNKWRKISKDLFADQRINQVSDDKKVRSFTAYHLRHYHASVLLNAGVQMKAVSKRLGHKDVFVTYKYYAHLEKGYDKTFSDIATEKLPVLE